MEKIEFNGKEFKGSMTDEESKNLLKAAISIMGYWQSDFPLDEPSIQERFKNLENAINECL